MQTAKRILLVNPQASPNFWSLERIRPMLGGRAPMCNLALPTLAALTPPTWEVVVCDEHVQNLEDALNSGPFDIIGLTAYLSQMRRAIQLLDRFKSETQSMLVMGGPAVTLDPGLVRERVEVLFRGEAERTWPTFLHDLESGQWQREYHEEKMISMESAPVPRADLLKHEGYLTGLVQTGRGCPFNCEFCDIVVMYGRTMRAKSPTCVVQELQHWHNLGYRQTFLADDNFIGNRRQAIDVLTAIRAWQADLNQADQMTLFTQASINLAKDQALMTLCREAGLTEVFVGIESPNPASLKGAGKMQNVRTDLLDSVHTLQRSGLIVSAGMIVGFDEDGPDIFDQQFEFLQAAGIPVVMCGQLYALAGTPLAERVEREGRLLKEHTGANSTQNTNFTPRGMTRDALMMGHWELIQRLYAPANFLARLKVLVDHLPEKSGDHRGLQEWQLQTMGSIQQFLRKAGPEAQEIRKFTRTAVSKNPEYELSLVQTLLYFCDMQLMIEQGPKVVLGEWFN